MATSLDPLKIKPLPPRKKVHRLSSGRGQREIGFGDVVISVGLDWDWESLGLDKLLYRLKTDKDVKVVTCCYDLIPVLFPQYCVGDVAAKFREYFANLTWSSSGMLCISRRSESDYLALAKELGSPRIPTKVMLLGNKLPEAGDDISDEVEALSAGRFILYVSTIERRKNHDVLYKALHILAESDRLDPTLKLVFVGMPGWGVSDLLKDFELDPLVSEQIVQLNYANDAELRRLYETCTFFVYPSLYEGWGLPVAEALSFDKFVIASNRGSIPEVGGDLVDYVDPWNATAWANAIEKYWNDPALLQARCDRISAEYHPIHWDETASAVLQLMDELIAEPLRAKTFEPGYDLSTVVGVHYGPRIVSTGKGGTFCYGPYVPLPKGNTRVDLEIEKLNEEPVALDFKFTAKHGAEVLHREVRTLDRSRSLKFELNLKQNVEEFEIVAICPDGAELSLNRLTITPSLITVQPTLDVASGAKRL
jgi:glycosyltransferase involved in cell wall biosynthesis